jgi:hypothetical protein
MIPGSFYRSVTILFLLLLALVPMSAQEAMYEDFSQVQGVFWINRSHVNAWNISLPDQNLDYRADEEYIIDLLELARQWFSGMIYGYRFEYTPSDQARQVEEYFLLEPIHEIPWGTPGLEYTGYFEANEKIEMGFRYFTADYEQARLRGWRSVRLANAAGQASTRDRTDLASREESFDEAVKQALRNYFRAVVPNKPRLITGTLALEEMPRSFADGGMVHTNVRISIDVGEVLAWDSF